MTPKLYFENSTACIYVSKESRKTGNAHLRNNKGNAILWSSVFSYRSCVHTVTNFRALKGNSRLSSGKLDKV